MRVTNDIEYVDKVVAFVDILGFANLVRSIDNDPKLHDRVYWALGHIRSYKSAAGMKNTAQSGLGISVFSDCVAITALREDCHNVIWAVSWLQANLLRAGILTRGGVSVGKVVHSDEILYGEGLIQAYEIERSAAVYPRVVLDPALAEALSERYRNAFLVEDCDGLYYLDPFALDATVDGAEALHSDGYDPHELYLDEVEKHIHKGLSAAGRVDHKSKWTWLSVRHAQAKNEYTRTRETKLSLLMKKV